MSTLRTRTISEPFGAPGAARLARSPRLALGIAGFAAATFAAAAAISIAPSAASWIAPGWQSSGWQPAQTLDTVGNGSLGHLAAALDGVGNAALLVGAAGHVDS